MNYYISEKKFHKKEKIVSSYENFIITDKKKEYSIHK